MAQKQNYTWAWALAGIGIAVVLLKKPAVTTVLNPPSDGSGTGTGSNTNQDYWSRNYYVSAPAGALLLTNDSAAGLAKTLHDANGLIWVDLSAIIAVFEQLRTKSQVSFLADKFFKLYGQSLQVYLQSILSSDNWAKVLAITNNLNNYN